jgi:hypothetical protein
VRPRGPGNEDEFVHDQTFKNFELFFMMSLSRKHSKQSQKAWLALNPNS